MPISVPNTIDILVVCGYFVASLVIGFFTRRKSRNSQQFLNASHALPFWVAALSFLAVNSGGLELVGLSALSAEHGLIALHFYLIGAIPAMIFLALFMIPIYVRSRAHSVPEFLLLRFNAQTRLLNSISLLIVSALIAGISLYAMAQTLHIFLGWDFILCAMTMAAVAILFLLLGGLRATIYNELLQLGLIIAGLTPLAIYVWRDFHGISGLMEDLPPVNAHLWGAMPITDPNAPIDRLGVFFGLGCILSFGYWCTDFRLMQRTLTVRKNQDARLVPLIAATGKLLFPLLVIVPGLAAWHFLNAPDFAGMRNHNYDQALPLLLHRYYGHGLLGLGLVAILASLMSGLAGNVATFASLWTQEVYRPYLVKLRSEQHYIAVGRISMFAGLLLSIATAFIALHFSNLMDYIQLLFSLFNAPLLAIFLLGMFTRWATPQGGFWGLSFGIAAGVTHNLVARVGWIQYGSQTTANFYGAIYAWSTATIATVLISLLTAPKPYQELNGLVFELNTRRPGFLSDGYVWAAALILALACIYLNILFW